MPTVGQFSASDTAVYDALVAGGVAERPAREKVVLFAEAAAVLEVTGHHHPLDHSTWLTAHCTTASPRSFCRIPAL